MRAALLVYLAVERTATIENVVRTLWPESEDTKGRHSLHQTTYRLRQTYGDVLEVVDGSVIAKDALQCDAQQWAECIANGADAEALELYGGRFLQGLELTKVSNEFVRWAEQIESRLVRQARGVRLRRVDTLLEARRGSQALPLVREWVRQEPSEDEGHDALIRVLYECEGPEAALAAFEDYREAFAAEDLKPLEETEAFAHRVRAEVKARGRPEYPPPVEAGSGESKNELATGPAAEAQSVRGESEPHGPSRLLQGIVAASTLIAIVFFGAMSLSRSDETPVGVAVQAPETNRIAVLNFEDLSADQSLLPLARGLSRSLIHELSVVPQIHVISTSGVRDLDPAAVGLSRIGDSLGVANIVMGQVQRSGENIRAFVQLVDPQNEEFVRSQQFDVSEDDLFELQDEITRVTSRFLRERLGDEIRVREYRNRASSVEAWLNVQRAYEMAEVFWMPQGQIPEHRAATADSVLTRAAALLDAAAELDPDWAEPLHLKARVALARLTLDGRTGGQADLDRVTEIAAMAEAALAKSPQFDRAAALLGHVLQSQSALVRPTDPAQADRLAQRADSLLLGVVRRNPAVAEAWWALTRGRYVRGDMEEARAFALRALEEDAYLQISADVYQMLFVANLTLRRLDEAEQWLRLGVKEFPLDQRFPAGLLALESWHGSMGLAPDSILSILSRVDEIDPPTFVGLDREIGYLHRPAMAAGALVRAGEVERGVAMLDSVRDIARREAVWWNSFLMDEAQVFMALSDTARARISLHSWLHLNPGMEGFVESLGLFDGLENPLAPPADTLTR